MATIKAFSDLEQSKKLAEILPLESANMYYPWYIEEDGDTIESGHRITIPNIGNFTTHKINKMILPCWSLAALLNTIPQIKIRGSKKIGYIVYYNKNIASNRSFDIIDACYKLILKLNELNLL